MRKIALAETDKRALVDDDDFEKVSRYSWYEHSDGYVVTNASKEDGGGKIYLHRLVLGIRSNQVQVDHENHNKLDNQKKNLKSGTQQQNLSNRRGYKPVGKANYSKSKCMACKDKPPKYRVLWNGGKNESWLCSGCFSPWFGENWEKVNYYDEIGEKGIPKRYRIRRTVKEQGVKKGSLIYLEKAGYTGAMIALFVPPEMAKKLTLKDGLPAEELHVTLAYLGEANELPDLEALKALTQQLASQHAPLSGVINGMGRFANTNSEGEQPFYVSPDLPDLPRFRHCIIEALEEMGLSCSKDHGFTPHITLKYIKAGQPTPNVTLKESPITFDTLTLALGGVRFDYSLTGGIEKALDFEIVEVEKQEERQLAYGLILRPNKPDSQGDIYTPLEVEKACHNYAAKNGGVTDWLHKTTLPKTTAVLVESFIAPVDFVWNGYQVLKGDWMGCAWVRDAEKWQAVKSGEIKSFSIKGTGRRIPVGS